MKAIPNFPGYSADETGNIYSMMPYGGDGGNSAKPPTIPRLLKPSKGSDGYLFVGLHKDGKRFQRLVHSLILETFVGERPDGMECCHNDGNKANNRLENLRWDTKKNNEADKIKHGTTGRGEKNGSAKLNEMQVRVIRRYCEMYGHGSQREIAKVFGVHRANIGKIVNRKIWQHI
jgi:hypothetical protein